MNSSSIGLPLLILAASASFAHAGIITHGPHEWKFADGGNGHFYSLVFPDNPQSADDNFSWFEARDAAANTVFQGSVGHLVTVTSAAEDAFLRQTFESFLQIRDFPNWLPGDFAWIGLTDELAEGQYQWITGEAFSYSNWASTEPNNLGDEDFVHYWRRFENGNNDGWSWNDKGAGPFLPDSRWGYIVEFDGPFEAVPEPASGTLWGLGAVGLICSAQFRKHRALRWH